MGTTITIRAPESLRAALAKEAAARGSSLSELVREILERAVAQRSLRDRAGHLKGQLALDRSASESWRQHLRERNWRP